MLHILYSATGQLFRFDLKLFDQWAAQHWMNCRVCGQRFRPTEWDAAFRHKLTHREEQREAQGPIETREEGEYEADAFPTLLRDFEFFGRLVRDGVIVPETWEELTATDNGEKESG